MNIRFSKEERDMIQRIHVLSGESYDTVRKIIESLCIAMTVAHLEKEPVEIPMLGNVRITFNKDVLTKDGREADISVSVEPSKSLKHVIGQIEDDEECDLEKELKKEITKIVRSLV